MPYNEAMNNAEAAKLKETITECEKRRPGLLVWGIILLIMGLVILFLTEVITDLLEDLDIIRSYDVTGVVVFGVIWIVGSVAMILAFVFGSIARKKHKEEAVQKLEQLSRRSNPMPASGAALTGTKYGPAPVPSASPSGSYCGVCGTFIPDTNAFCPNCGTPKGGGVNPYPAPAPAPEPTPYYGWNPEPTPAPEPTPMPEPAPYNGWNPEPTPEPEPPVINDPGPVSGPESPKGFKPAGRF